MKFKSSIIVVILFQAVFPSSAEKQKQRIIFNKYQIIEAPVEIGYISSFGIPVESFAIQTKQNYLELNEYGMITINSNVTTNETLMFKVLMKKSNSSDYIESTVYLTVTILTDEIIENNAFVIFKGVTSAEFTSYSQEQSQYDLFTNFLNKKLKLESCNDSTNINLQIFSIKSENDPIILDVRFTVRSITKNHNKTYFQQDKLHWILWENQEEIEKMLNLKIESIGSDKCLMKEGLCKSLCKLKVKKDNQYQNVSAFGSFFMGPEIELKPVCASTEKDSKFKDKQSFKVKRNQLPGECYHVLNEIKDFESMDMSFDLIFDSINGTVLYFTPREFKTKNIFLLQLVNGFPTLIIAHESSEHQVSINCLMKTSVKYSILISFRRNMIHMIINNNDNCRNSTTFLKNDIKYNFNFVLQHGTALPNIQSIAKHFNWTYKPQTNFINGTIYDLKSTIFYNQDFLLENDHSNAMKQNKTSDWPTANIAIVLIVLATIIIIVIILLLILYPYRNHVRIFIILK